MSGHEMVVRWGPSPTPAAPRLLVEKGASLTKTDVAGRNAMVIAIIHGSRDVVTTILESPCWRDALKNEYISTSTGKR